MVKPKTFAHAVDLKWGGAGCKSHYCQVLNILAVMMSFTLILLVVHKTPPETIALHLKENKHGNGNNIKTCTIY